MKLLVSLLAVISACAGGSTPASPSQPGRLEAIAYDAPLDWVETTGNSARGGVATWVPANNFNKESLVISRATVEPGRPTPTVESARDLLVVAQQALPHGQVAAAQAFVTPAGLHGVSVETEFMPAGATGRYHRVHAVLLDGSHYVHVLYTAQRPDLGHRAFDLVVRSLHEET